MRRAPMISLVTCRAHLHLSLTAAILVNVMLGLLWADFLRMLSEVSPHCGTGRMMNAYSMNCCLVASIPILLWAFDSYRSHRAAMTRINRFLACLPLTVLVALNLSHLAIRQFISLYPAF